MLDIIPGGHASGVEDIVTLLQRYDAKAVRRRFKELSVVVHPDKCTLVGARQVHIVQPPNQTMEGLSGCAARHCNVVCPELF